MYNKNIIATKYTNGDLSPIIKFVQNKNFQNFKSTPDLSIYLDEFKTLFNCKSDISLIENDCKKNTSKLTNYFNPLKIIIHLMKIDFNPKFAKKNYDNFEIKLSIKEKKIENYYFPYRHYIYVFFIFIAISIISLLFLIFLNQKNHNDK
tara:strand:- start:517 stop:963 length:447 start_codon:yes stop_codon:yes gene_type:complete